MGLFFTLLYIATAYLTPPVLLGPLGMYHAEVFLAVPTIIFSIMNLGGTGFFSLPQTWGGFGLIMAVALSLAATGWIGGAPLALLDFLPYILVFLFIVCNCKKKIHLQLLFAVLFAVTAFVIVQSQIAIRQYGMSTEPVNNTYFMVMGPLRRIQGLGVIGDPNDFGQFMMGLMPGLFFFWVKGKTVLNLIRVYIPTAIVLTGITLTHSRGALLALGAVLVFAFRKKIGLIPSVIGGVVMLGGLMAAGFTGGRDVNAANGEDRMEAWSTGLQLIRAHPLFGIGYRHFGDYFRITAHNTIVVCAAEVGLIGLFCWIIFMLATMRDCYVVSVAGLEDEAAKKQEAAETPTRYGARHAPAAALPSLAFAAPRVTSGPTSSLLLDDSLTGSAHSVRQAPPAFIRPGELPSQVAAPTRSQSEPLRPMQPSFANVVSAGLPPEEIRRLANLVIYSFVGLFVTGWFLSRCFAMVFFMYGGIAAVVVRMAREAGMEVPRLTIPRAMKLSIAPTIILLAIVYIILRVDHLFPQ